MRDSGIGKNLDRLVSVRDGDESAGDSNARFHFELVLLMLLFAKPWAAALAVLPNVRPAAWIELAAVTFLCAVACDAQLRRPAFVALGLVLGLTISTDFRYADDFAFMGMYCCLLSGLLEHGSAEENRFHRVAVRSMVCLAFLYIGLQRLLSGHFFDGSYLAYAIRTPSFEPLLGAILPEADFERLLAFSGQVGSGPYASDALGLLIVSNAAYIVPIALALLLIPRRTRTGAVWAGLLFVSSCVLFTRSVFETLLLANGLMIFLAHNANRYLWIPTSGVLTGCILSRLGWVPEVAFR